MACMEISLFYSRFPLHLILSLVVFLLKGKKVVFTALEPNDGLVAPMMCAFEVITQTDQLFNYSFLSYIKGP